MSRVDPIDTSGQSRRDRSMDRVNEALETARSGSSWLPWTGLALAFIWWASIAGLVVYQFGIGEVLALGPPLLLVATMLVLLPGLLVIVGATMAAEQRRSARANAVILQAAGQLLHPARAVAGESVMLADAMKTSASSIETEVRKALNTMREASTQLGDERMRMESVSYACADNARDLTERLTEERRLLENITRDLRAQLDQVETSIPRQAELVVESCQRAAAALAGSDSVLEDRLSRLDGANADLGRALAEIDRVTDVVSQRQQAFAQDIARLGSDLSASRNVTEDAMRASEMATQAAKDTGAALQAAVADAIEKAHRAALDIQSEARDAMKLTDAALADMRASAAAAISVANGTDMGADTPREAPQASHTAATDASTGGPQRTRGMDDIFEDFGGQPTTANGPTNAAARAEPVQPPVIRVPERPAPTAPEAAPQPAEDMRADPVNRPSSVVQGAASLRSILADIDKADGVHPTLGDGAQHLDSGIALVERLSASGIALPRVFRSRDNKKLMQAAKQGEGELRRTVQTIAGDEVHRVAVRLRKDGGLMGLAREFVGQDGHGIVSALASREKSMDASLPRISAFLLVDAALNQDARH